MPEADIVPTSLAMYTVELAVTAVCIVLSFLFSGSETALTGASQARMHALELEGNPRARLVNRLRMRKDRMIGGLLIGNNVVNILASAMATSVAIKVFGDAGVAYATGVMAVLIIIFSEVLPKTYALHNADALALRVAPLINAIVLVLSPFSDIIAKIVRGALRIFGVDLSKTPTGLQEEELRGVIELYHGAEESIVAEVEEERAMLRSILELNDLTIEEVMVHRRNVEMIDANQSLQDIVDIVLKSRYTRLPVFQETHHNIIGVIEVKLLLVELRRSNGDWSRFNLAACMREPWFVPDSTTLFEQLQEFRRRHAHFAVIVDEYGEYMGVVTLEDILEEIVGEIGYDETHKLTIHGVRPQKDGSYLVDGKVTIRELNREFGWSLPDRDYTTIAGLLLHETQRIPLQGQAFQFGAFRYEVVRRQRNQLTVVRVMPPAPVDEITAEEDRG